MRWNKLYRLRHNIGKAAFMFCSHFVHTFHQECLIWQVLIVFSHDMYWLRIKALICPPCFNCLLSFLVCLFLTTPTRISGGGVAINSNLKRHRCPIRGLLAPLFLIVQHWGPLHYHPALRVSQRAAQNKGPWGAQSRWLQGNRLTSSCAHI